ncbi:YqaJ viral recombinase family protein [Candidatus Pacearchaeota archaeon]|nr:YqaJ viral recombinase family protein [Candidatus Pacearchaeota archaeon]
MLRPKIIRGIAQGSSEWKKLRVGSIGGTNMHTIMAKGKGRTTLLYKLASELITGEKHESKADANMKRGIELEPAARAAFEFQTGLEVEEITLIQGTINHCHISPDGLIKADKSNLEIKCLTQPVHAKYLDEGVIVEDKYMTQIQWGLAVSHRKKCWFYVWHPKMKSLKIEVMPDKPYIKSMEKEACLFIHDMKKLVKKIS